MNRILAGLMTTFLVLSCLPSFSMAQIPQSERAALIALYNATNGDKWTSNNVWKGGTLHQDGFSMPGEENRWYGVTTNAAKDHVTALNLPGNMLEGSLPPELGDLTHLAKMDFSGNRLGGPIPPQLGSLINMTILNLSNNGLDGEIPPQLGDLANLVDLYLQRNYLTGALPPDLGKLDKLFFLFANRNTLEGPLPQEFTGMAELQILDIHHNKLSGPIPPWLGSLPKLEQALLHANLFTGTLSGELGQLSLVKKLDFSENRLTGGIPHEFGNLQTLKELKIHSNDLGGSIPVQLGGLSLLEVLELNDNRLCGPVPDQLLNLSVLMTGKSDFRNNHLSTENQALKTFLDGKQEGGDWQSHQTPCLYRGDLNQDNMVSLPDVLMGLGMQTGVITKCQDIIVGDGTEDGKIGLDDSVYAMRALALSPQLGTMGNVQVAEGQELTFTVPVDVQGPVPLVFQVDGLPASATLDSSTGVFSWTPTLEEGGEYYPRYYAINEYGGIDFQTVTITVTQTSVEEQWELEDSQDPAKLQMDFTIRYTAQDRYMGDASWTMSQQTAGQPGYSFAVDGAGVNSPLYLNPNQTGGMSFTTSGTIVSNAPYNGQVITYTMHLTNMSLYQGNAGGSWQVDLPQALDLYEEGFKGDISGVRVGGGGVAP